MVAFVKARKNFSISHTFLWLGRQGTAVPITLAGGLVLMVSRSALTLSLHLAWHWVSCMVQLHKVLVVLVDWRLKYFHWFLFTWVLLYCLTDMKPCAWCQPFFVNGLSVGNS